MSPRESRENEDGPKYLKIYTELHRWITESHYREGDKLPSESELVKEFAASRPTVARALSQLESQGLVERRAGSGTYVTRGAQQRSRTFGLLIPELGITEVFEPICQGISQARIGSQHDLLWGPLFDPAAPKEVQAEKLCDYYLKRNLSGIFFAPLELSDGMDEVNHRIVQAFDEARVPIVLLDRDICEYPNRSKYDLVGIDNRRAAFVITKHLVDSGARRIAFYARPKSAPTVNQRVLGYHEALALAGRGLGEGYVEYGDPTDAPGIRKFLDRFKPDAIVCANDITAARLMAALGDLDIKVPSQIRITGMDDAKYAGLLQVPLTTIHQPCIQLGATAMLAMLDRVAHPEMLARDFLVDFHLVVRRSSGAME